MIVFAVGLATRTRDVGGDDTVFATAVDGWLQGRGDPAVLFATHHMLYNPAVAVVTWLGRIVRPGLLVLDAGAAVSSLFCALAAGGLVPVLRRGGVGEAHAVLAAALVASCGGMWAIATRMEVYTVAAAAVVGWLAAVTAVPRRPLVVGAALAAAVLAHDALALLVVPTVWSLRREIRALGAALLVGLGAPAIVTLALFTLGRGVWTPAGWLGLLAPQDSLGYLRPGDLALAPRALRGLLLWDWYRAVPVLRPGVARAFDLAGGLALLAAAGLVSAGLWRAARRATPLGRASALALAAFVPLWLVWDVGNPEHFVAAAPLFGVLAALGAAALPRRVGSAALTALLALLLTVNGIGGAALQRRPENGRVWVTASFVQQAVPPDGVILAVGVDSRLRLGLGYLAGRRIYDLTLAVRSARLAGRPATDGLVAWIDRARGAPQVWALDDVFEASSERWVEELGIPLERWHAELAKLVSERVVELEADGAVLRRPFRLHLLLPGGRA